MKVVCEHDRIRPEERATAIAEARSKGIEVEVLITRAMGVLVRELRSTSWPVVTSRRSARSCPGSGGSHPRVDVDHLLKLSIEN
jgi:hypothetical protein